MKITYIHNIISNIIERLNGFSISEDTANLIIIGIIFLVFITGATKALLRLGKRVLVVAFLTVFTIFAGPKINLFILNHIGQYNIIEIKLSEIVKGDIEEKVNREYMMETGINLRNENPELLEELMVKEYAINPNDSDEVNIIKHAGFPQVVLRTILLNIDNSHKTMIKADNFYDYAARFVTLRLLTFLSYSLAFFLACDIIDGKKYPNLG